MRVTGNDAAEVISTFDSRSWPGGLQMSRETGSATRRVQALATEIELVFGKSGAHLASPSQECLQSFAGLSSERQHHIETALQEYLDVIGDLNSAVVVPADVSREQEIKLLKRALWLRKLRLADSAILDVIDNRDIIEIYDDRGVQIYRSWSFFQYCSYSLVDLQVYDWDILFARPNWVAKELWQISEKAFAPGAKTTSMDHLPEYLICERLKKHNRAFLMKMKYTSPVTDDAGDTRAIIVVSRLQHVPETFVGHSESVSLL